MDTSRCTLPVPRSAVRRHPVGRSALAVLTCALLLVATACSKDSNPTSPSNTEKSPTTSSGTQTTPANNGIPVYDVSVKSFTYHGMPSTVPANSPFMVSFTNKESFDIIHEFVVLKLPDGKTAQDVINDGKKKGAKGEDDWIHVGDSGDIETDGSVVMTFDLPPGNYVATCWQTGKAGGGSGPPHVTIGMATPFTAK
jgi:hypothetical protein